jgi:Flp pilus assembly protein TadG
MTPLRFSLRTGVLEGERGQATVELVAILPLILIVGLVAAAFVAAQSAGETAGAAAQAGAMAVLQGGDARTAARAALPRGSHATIAVHGRRVAVRVRPHLPFRILEGPLTAAATADAGAAP